MTKYIIKNCPAFSVCGICVSQEAECLCKDCTDCLLKQIVKKCKNIACDVLINTSINNKGRKNRCGAMDNMPLCCELIGKKDILSLLEIEEVNE